MVDSVEESDMEREVMPFRLHAKAGTPQQLHLMVLLATDVEGVVRTRLREESCVDDDDVLTVKASATKGADARARQAKSAAGVILAMMI